MLESSGLEPSSLLEIVRDLNDTLAILTKIYFIVIAISALKDIIIELQGSLLMHLRQASEDDGMTDFSVLVDASDIGRIKAVSVLHHLYLRTAESATIPRGATQALPPAPASSLRVNGQDRDDSTLLPPHLVPRTGNPAEISVPSNGLEETIPPTSPTQPPPSYRLIESHNTFTSSTKRRLSVIFSRKPTFISGDIPGGKIGSPDGIVDDSIPAHNSGSNSNRFLAMTILSQEPLDEDNPWVSEISRSPNKTRKKSPQIRQSPETERPIIFQRQSSNTSKVESKDDFHGFCKGAFKLQVGRKDGLKLKNQSESFGGEAYYWVCGSSKCAFQHRACKGGKEWGFDDTIHSSYGVRYRWTFLAKSHVALSKVKDGIHDYCCVFCVLQGHDSPVFRGIKALMKHVSQHRNQQFDEAFLRKHRCINMREAMDEEDFDINLVPDDIKTDERQAMERTTPDDVTAAWSMNEDTMPDTNHWRD